MVRHQYTRAGAIASIYGLVDPREPGAVRYVGATRRTLGVRRYQHEQKAMSGVDRNGAIYRCSVQEWVKGLLDAGLRPAFFLIDRVDRSLGSSAESYWIQCFRHHGGDLLNEALPQGDPLRYVALLDARMAAAGTWKYQNEATLLAPVKAA